MATLADLIKEIPQGTYFTDAMGKHATNGVPTKSWLGIFNTGYSLTQIVSQFFYALRASVAELARAQFLEYASGVGLTLLARSQYQLERIPSQFTKGTIRLTAVAAAPVHVIAAGDLTVSTRGPEGPTKRYYSNTTGGTLNPGGTLDLTFCATQPGQEWNIPPNSPLDLNTSKVGVTASNPPVGLTGTWITQAGAPEEQDPRLKLRCVTRWGTLGRASNEDAFVYWALQIPNGYTSSPVAQVRVFANRLGGAQFVIVGGGVTIVVAGPAGALPQPDVDAVADIMESPLPHLGVTLKKKYNLCGLCLVVSARNLTVPITGTVYVKRSANIAIAEVQGQVTASLTDFQASILIGQEIYTQKLGARIEDANKVAIRNVVLTAPAVDRVIPDIDQYPVLDAAGLTYVLVDP